MSKPLSLSARKAAATVLPAKSIPSNIAKTLWVVEGSSGQYEDYRTWIVCAYLTQQEAEQHARLANERARELYERYAQEVNIAVANEDINARWPKMGKNQWDADMSTSEESSYCVYRIPLRSFIAPLTQSDTGRC